MKARRKLIVVSNRGPIGYVREGGERVARRGAGGLVTALAPLVSHHDVTWIASALSDEDRVVATEGPVEADRSRRLAVPAEARRARHRRVRPLLPRGRQSGVVVRSARPVGVQARARARPSPGLGGGVRPGQQRLRRGGRRGAGPRPRHCGLLPRLPPVPRAEARAGAAAQGSDRALHPHPVGGAGRLVGAAGRDGQGDPREPALLRRCQLPHESMARGVPSDVR